MPVMGANVEIRTPEQVELSFALAGIASRGIAQLLDLLFLTVFYLALVVGVVIAEALHAFGTGTSYVVAILVVLGFFSFWGYFIVLEYFLSGQTLGKKICKIRVIHKNGRPISFYGAVIRNLVRVVDFLPPVYLLGMISMLADRKERRIGDLAAGTLVVLDKALWQLEPMQGRVPERTDNQQGIPDFNNRAMSVRVVVDQSPIHLVFTPPLSQDWQQFFTTFANRCHGLDPAVRDELTMTAFERFVNQPGVELKDGDGPLSSTHFVDSEIQYQLLVTLAKNLRNGRLGKEVGK